LEQGVLLEVVSEIGLEEITARRDGLSHSRKGVMTEASQLQ
jgi:hypothetical protein